MIDMLMAAEAPMTLCVIGPQSNMKPALERQPEIAKKARIVTMAGSVHIGYDGKEGRAAEWNVMRDPAAAQAVFAAPWEIVMAPLDICGTLRLEGARYEEVAQADSALAKVTIENYIAWTNRKHHPENASSVLFDTAATYLCYDEKYMEIETIKLSIDDKGNTYPDEENGRPVRVALRWKDREAFEKEMVDAIVNPAAPAASK
jgi:inosine-uridine nucleoside N-ribohydrolase